MKLGTIEKIDELKKSGFAVELLNKLLEDGQTAIELFGRCELHPGMHAFSAIYQDKQDIIRAAEETKDWEQSKCMTGECTIYGRGKVNTYLVNAVFDEIIDDIVGALEANCLKEK